MTDTILHTKYRPQSLDRVIGHETAVTRIKGMFAQDRVPNAFLITGPSAVGKTTIARCIAAEINGKPVIEQQTDYKEINLGSERSIEDMRDLIKLSKFQPSGKRRVFVLDEAQALLANHAAATTLLKPLEESGSTKTLWILCSMDPGKFGSGNGKAIANRCSQIVLEPHTDADLLAQAKRIVVGEKMDYLKNTALLETIVQASNSEMRTLANLVQGAQEYYAGLKTKPAKFDPEMLSKVLQSTETNDDRLVISVVAGALTGKYAQVQRALLDVTDPFQFLNRVLWAAQFLLNKEVVNGRHPKVWFTPVNKEIINQLKAVKLTLGHYAAFNECVVNTKIQAQGFAVGATELLSARIYRFIKENAK